MRLRQIEVFRAVMLVGTVSEAARMLAVSQPVVTRVLQHTELQLGFRLFDRTKGRLQPTAEAFELFTEVERLYQEVERVRRVSANLRHKGAGRLRVAATPSLAPSILAPAVRHFSQRHPDTQVRVFTHHTAEIVQGLLSQDIDVGFAFAPPVHPAIGTTPVAQGASCWPRRAPGSMRGPMGRRCIAWSPNGPSLRWKTRCRSARWSARRWRAAVSRPGRRWRCRRIRWPVRWWKRRWA